MTALAGAVPRSCRQTEVAGKNQPIKILLYSTAFLPNIGGVENAVAHLARGLLKAGHQPTVVTQAAAGSFDDRDLAFGVVRRPRLRELSRLISETGILHLAGPAFLPLMLGLLRLKPVVIEHHGYQAICPNGLLLYAPCQTACPGHFMAGNYGNCLRCVARTDGWLYSLRQLFLAFPRRWMCRRASVNAAISRHVEKRLQLPRSRSIYYGIPDVPAETNSLVPISSAPICFGFVGRLVEEKGLMILLEAACRLRERGYDFHLKFIGDGPERTRLERKVLQSGLCRQVTFMGPLSGELLREATADLVAVVMPSIMEETAGLAAIEQMMRGRLVIASDIGGLGEIVGEAGLKFSAGDPQQLASCMQRVLDKPYLANEIGTRARRRSLELFSESRTIDEHLALYQGVLR